MSKIKSESVLRNPNDLKPDPEQPRKKFDQEKINNLSQTMKSQGIINPIEIDEKDMIITGEIRWRASKKAGLKEIECKQIIGLDGIERFERQFIENLHHNLLDSEEIEKGIEKLWNSDRYINYKDLASKTGYKNEANIRDILRALQTRKELKIKNAAISTRSLADIGRIKNEEDRKKLAEKVIKKEVRPTEIRQIVKTIKEVEIKAPDVKEELLKPEVKITEEKLKEVKEIAELPQDIRKEVLKPKSKITIEEAKEVAKMPEDIKKEVLKPDSEITVEEAKDISVIPKPELRKEAVKVVKKQKRDQKRTMDYMQDVSTGKVKPPQKIIDLDMKIINQFTQIYKQVIIKMTKRLVESYNEQTKVRLLKIMKGTLIHLQKELNIKGEIIDAT